MVALIGAGCSNAPAEDQHRHRQRTTTANRDKAVRFAECMRENGVSEFPDPDASGELTIDGVVERLVAGPEHRGVEAGHRRVQGPAATGVHGHARRSAKEQEGRLEFAQCIRDNGVKDFPDPAQDEPLVDTNRIPSADTEGGMSILNAAMQKCGDSPRTGWGAGEAEDVGAGRSGRPGRRDRHRRRGRHVRWEASDPGRTGAPANTVKVEGGALRHGLPGWDPDLSGAIGRLAVLRDQPGPRDIHQAAR